VSYADKLFTSLAVQLALNMPSLQTCIRDAVRERSDIASLSLLDQWRQLVLGPLSRLGQSHQSYVLVIDALDECEGDNNVRITRALNQEQNKRRKLVGDFVKARSMAGAGEKGDMFRRLLLKALGPEVSLVDENLNRLVQELTEEVHGQRLETIEV